MRCLLFLLLTVYYANCSSVAESTTSTTSKLLPLIRRLAFVLFILLFLVAISLVMVYVYQMVTIDPRIDDLHVETQSSEPPEPASSKTVVWEEEPGHADSAIVQALLGVGLAMLLVVGVIFLAHRRATTDDVNLFENDTLADFDLNVEPDAKDWSDSDIENEEHPPTSDIESEQNPPTSGINLFDLGDEQSVT